MGKGQVVMLAAALLVASGCSSASDGGAAADSAVDSAGGVDSAISDTGAPDSASTSDTPPDTGCGSCAKGFKCASGICAVDGLGTWTVRAVSGTVSSLDCTGAPWDIGGGDPALPDPQVCLTIHGLRTCAPSKTNTVTPTWGFDFPSDIAANIEPAVEFEYFDFDTLTAADPICTKGPVAIGDAEFKAGALVVECKCPSGSVVGHVDFALAAK